MKANAREGNALGSKKKGIKKRVGRGTKVECRGEAGGGLFAKCFRCRRVEEEGSFSVTAANGRRCVPPHGESNGTRLRARKKPFPLPWPSTPSPRSVATAAADPLTPRPSASAVLGWTTRRSGSACLRFHPARRTRNAATRPIDFWHGQV